MFTSFKKVLEKASNYVDDVLKADEEKPKFDKAMLEPEEVVYDRLLDNAQFQMVHITREYQEMVREREEKIQAMKAKLVELGHPFDESSFPKKRVGEDGVTGLAPDGTSLEAFIDTPMSSVEYYEDQLKIAIKQKNMIQVELIRYTDLLNKLTDESAKLKQQVKEMLDDEKKMQRMLLKHEKALQTFKENDLLTQEKCATLVEKYTKLEARNAKLKEKLKAAIGSPAAAAVSTPTKFESDEVVIEFDAESRPASPAVAMTAPPARTPVAVPPMLVPVVKNSEEELALTKKLEALERQREIDAAEMKKKLTDLQNRKAADEEELRKKLDELEKRKMGDDTDLLARLEELQRQKRSDELALQAKVVELEKKKAEEEVLLRQQLREAEMKRKAEDEAAMNARLKEFEAQRKAEEEIALRKKQEEIERMKNEQEKSAVEVSRLSEELNEAQLAAKRAQVEAESKVKEAYEAKKAMELREVQAGMLAEQAAKLEELHLQKERERHELLTKMEGKAKEEKTALMEKAAKEAEEMRVASQKAARDAALAAEAAVKAKLEEELANKLASQASDAASKLSSALNKKDEEYNAKLAKHEADLLAVFAAKEKALKAESESKVREVQEEAEIMAKAIRNEMKREIEQAKLLYEKEAAKRKEIHNKLVELQGNIRVYCRVRPIMKHELDKGDDEAMEVTDYSGTDGEIGIRKLEEKSSMSGKASKVAVQTFEFDHVFKQDSTQVQVFAEVQPMITSVIDGFNVCIFAYGQTGSGKTFTMEGAPDNRGVTSRSINDLFSICESKREKYDIKLEMSMLEIYNEKVRDLIVPAKKGEEGSLDIKLSKTGGTYVEGLQWSSVDSPDDVSRIVTEASKNRATGSTNMNAHSSRSHLVMCLTCAMTSKHSGAKTRGKLYLIDLAGSERLAKTDAEGARLEEAKNINKSLSALGDVIAALGSESKHVPFRNSKLTYLLQDSLSGDSKVLMFVNASPVAYNATETITSLKFAERCRAVSLGKASKNVDSSGEVAKLRRMVDALKAKLGDAAVEELDADEDAGDSMSPGGDEGTGESGSPVKAAPKKPAAAAGTATAGTATKAAVKKPVAKK